MKEGASIILHLDCLSALDCLTDEQAGVLFKGLLRYANTGEPLSSSDSALQAVFALFRAQIDRDAMKYAEKCRKNRANACKRYAGKSDGNQDNAVACSGMPSQADASISKSNPNNNSNSKDDDNADANIINGEDALSFDTIWERYGKPIGKKELIKPLWDALNDEDKAAIYAYIPLYVRSTPEIRYRKNLNNFLLERYWESHPLTPNDNERNGSSTSVITRIIEEGKKSAMQQSKPLTALATHQEIQAYPSNMPQMLQKYPTWDDFFRIISVNRQILICKNPKICILYPSPTLHQIDCMYGPLSAAKWLIPFIADASLSCGLKIDATKEQLQFTATAITGRYTWLKAAEMVLFFFNFKAGFYEKFYGQFDPQAIIRSIKLFMVERDTIIIQHERELQQKRNEENAPSRNRGLP